MEHRSSFVFCRGKARQTNEWDDRPLYEGSQPDKHENGQGQLLIRGRDPGKRLVRRDWVRGGCIIVDHPFRGCGAIFESLVAPADITSPPDNQILDLVAAHAIRRLQYRGGLGR